MARTKLVNGVRLPFTVEEETARDAEEAADAILRAEQLPIEQEQIRLDTIRKAMIRDNELLILILKQFNKMRQDGLTLLPALQAEMVKLAQAEQDNPEP